MKYPNAYVTPSGQYLVRVVRYSKQYRASTNDSEFYIKHLYGLPYRNTEEEAQHDLDSLAAKLGLERNSDRFEK